MTTTRANGWRPLVLSAAGRHRGLIAAAAGLSILDAVILLAMPWPLAVLADDVLGSGDLPSSVTTVLDALGADPARAVAVLVGVAMVGLVVVQQAVRAAINVVNSRLTRRLTHTLGLEVLMRTYARSASADGTIATGDATSRVLNDANAAQFLVVGVAIPAFHSVVTVVLMAVVMVRLNAWLTIVALLVSIPLVLSLRVHARRMTVVQHKAAEQDGAVWSHAERTLGALPEVQTDVAEERQLATFASVVGDRVRAELASERAEIAFALTNTVVTAIGLGGMLILGALLVTEGQLTVGALLVFNSYLVSVFGPLNSLAYLGASYARVAAHGRRLLEVFESGEVIVEREDPVVLPGPVRGRVCFEDVWFSYEEGLPVLCGVSFGVEPGETVALVGVTGSGKSTLVSLVPRLMDVCGGCVRLDGVDVRDLALRVVRESVSVVRQEPLLLPVSVADNVAFARPGASFEEVWEAARAANALEFIERLPQGFDTVLGERGDTLSGGQKQRLAIARALLKDAPVLILDEPTSALDAGTEHLVVEALQRVTRDRTVMIVTHRESTIVHADRVVRLEHGRVIAGAHR
jgi:ATP-binding cassette subfamily B protein